MPGCLLKCSSFFDCFSHTKRKKERKKEGKLREEKEKVEAFLHRQKKCLCEFQFRAKSNKVACGKCQIDDKGNNEKLSDNQ